ncbi:MAG: MFS transporter [Burkholderiales bacterium]|jgi:MFS family permease|nr:MFS transporter [Burkholderiales bacterium]
MILRNTTMAQIAIALSSFLVPFIGSALNLALPQIGRDLGMNVVTLGLMVSAYLLPCAMFQMPAARLGDLYGRRKIFLLGVGGFTLFSFLSSLAWSSTTLIAFRALTGVSSAMMFGTAIAILTSLFPLQQRGKVLGINTTVVYSALSIGPILGGLLTHYLGWRSIFVACCAISATAFTFSLIAIRDEWAEARGEPFDLVGSALYALMLFAVICGFSLLPDTTSWMLLILGIIAAIVFVRYEARHRFPVFKLDLLVNNRAFRLSTIAAMINYSATSASTFLLSLYLQSVRGLDAQHAGFLLVLQPIIQTLVSPLAGRWSDRVHPASLATAGMSMVTLALFGLCFLTENTPWLMFVALLLLLGAGFGIFSSPNVNMIMSSVDKAAYGTASAVTGTARLIGQSFSIGIATLAIHLYLGTASITPAQHAAYMSSLRLTCAVFAALCLVGNYASAARLKK